MATKKEQKDKTTHNRLMIEQHESTINRRKTQVFRKGRQLLLHLWNPSC